jgi:hypothetical protein
LSEIREKGEGIPSFSYTKAIYSRFAFHLAIGMTEEQYFDGDSTLAKYYREADELRKERMNQELWLQGMYFYDAMSRLSPILKAFAKAGTKPMPYVEEPYPINDKSKKESEERKEKAMSDKGLRYIQDYMLQANKRLEGRE